MKQFQKKAIKEILDQNDVILSTTTMANDKVIRQYVESIGGAFDIVVIDECAQATEPSCWIPL